jgi:hypothetical protein
MFELVRGYESCKGISIPAAERQLEEISILRSVRQCREGVPAARARAWPIEYRVKLVRELVMTDLTFALDNSEREPFQIGL